MARRARNCVAPSTRGRALRKQPRRPGAFLPDVQEPVFDGICCQFVQDRGDPRDCLGMNRYFRVREGELLGAWLTYGLRSSPLRIARAGRARGPCSERAAACPRPSHIPPRWSPNFRSSSEPSREKRLRAGGAVEEASGPTGIPTRWRHLHQQRRRAQTNSFEGWPSVCAAPLRPRRCHRSSLHLSSESR